MAVSHPVLGQISVLTQHYDNARSGQNVHETLLTHSNVNVKQFGKLFTHSLDGQAPGQPLYVPNVFLQATKSTHNVIYVVTQHDSVYAFDADDDQGANASPLWQSNFLDVAHGVTSIPIADESCNITAYSEFGIQSTPVIDLSKNAIYVLAMTKENGNYVHRLHALDLSTGAELFGGPTTVTASVTINNQTFTFIDKYQMQRPGLLLQNGNVYIAFGSPGCNKTSEMGWVMAYDASTLQQIGAFNVSPGKGASAIWMSGAGTAGDGSGNVYFSTGDGLFDVNGGGDHYGNSVLKLSANLNFLDYFTPFDQKSLQTLDLDLGAGQVLILPPQVTAPNNLLLSVGKAGVLYLLDRNNMGQFNPVDNSQIVQEVRAPVTGEVHAGLTYWNNTLYLYAETSPIMAYSFTSGRLSANPISQTLNSTFVPRGGIISSNGTQDGILWCATPDKKLFAFDATNLATLLYNSGLGGTRDALDLMVHFTMPIVANGRVYLNTRDQLAVFGLLPFFKALSGNNQTGVVGSTLAIPLKAALTDAYTLNPDATSGLPVTFIDGGVGGVFSNQSTVTDNSGVVSTTYTLPLRAGTYTITARSTYYPSATFTVTATTGSPATLAIASGNFQSATVVSTLPVPLKVKVKDPGGNGIPGVVVNFSDGSAGGSFSSASAVSDSSGNASTSYTAGTKSGNTKITASSGGLASVIFTEQIKSASPVSLKLFSGNNQTVTHGTVAPKLLRVISADQYGNPVAGVAVSYSDGSAGGTLSPNPAVTAANGVAGSQYTAPAVAATVTVTASATGVGSVSFTVNVK